MNASEARMITRKALEDPVIQPFLDAIYEQIERQAKKRQFNVFDPLYEFEKVRWVSDSDRIAIADALIAQGYTVSKPVAGIPYILKISWDQ